LAVSCDFGLASPKCGKKSGLPKDPTGVFERKTRVPLVDRKMAFILLNYLGILHLHLKKHAAVLYIEGSTFPMGGGKVDSTGEME
jgi:hypothetical protein